MCACRHLKQLMNVSVFIFLACAIYCDSLGKHICIARILSDWTNACQSSLVAWTRKAFSTSFHCTITFPGFPLDIICSLTTQPS